MRTHFDKNGIVNSRMRLIKFLKIMEAIDLKFALLSHIICFEKAKKFCSIGIKYIENKMVHIGPYLLTRQIHLANRGWTAAFPAVSLCKSARWSARTLNKNNLVYYHLCPIIKHGKTKPEKFGKISIN